ncbi:MAG: RNA polymerase sigma factor [Oscillospiraceae bacterium]
MEDETETKELARLIEAFLNTLTVKERVIFMRRYAYADTYADIAKRVGISEKCICPAHSDSSEMKQYLREREVFV